MRHGRSTKQHVWLGPGGYRRRCRDAVTNSDAESHAITNSFTCCMRADKSNTYRNGNSNCYCYSYGYSYSYCDSYGYGYSYGYSYSDNAASTYTHFHAETDTDTEAWANDETSSHSGAKTLIPKWVDDQ